MKPAEIALRAKKRAALSLGMLLEEYKKLLLAEAARPEDAFLPAKKVEKAISDFLEVLALGMYIAKGGKKPEYTKKRQKALSIPETGLIDEKTATAMTGAFWELAFLIEEVQKGWVRKFGKKLEVDLSAMKFDLDALKKKYPAEIQRLEQALEKGAKAGEEVGGEEGVPTEADLLTVKEYKTLHLRQGLPWKEPELWRRAGVQVGESVKLCTRIPGEAGLGEPLFVDILSVTGQGAGKRGAWDVRYLGQLPDGGQISFGPEHVIQIGHPGAVGEAPRWRLKDVEEMAKAHPDTFEIPARGNRAGLIYGDIAKLIFVHPGEQGERMWVKVTEVKKNGEVEYQGSLDNTSVFDDSLVAGFLISFGPEHVADIVRMDEEEEEEILPPKKEKKIKREQKGGLDPILALLAVVFAWGIFKGK